MKKLKAKSEYDPEMELVATRRNDAAVMKMYVDGEIHGFVTMIEIKRLIEEQQKKRWINTDERYEKELMELYNNVDGAVMHALDRGVSEADAIETVEDILEALKADWLKKSELNYEK